MKLYEHVAKDVFATYGIPVPQGLLVKRPEDLREIVHPVAIKAQVLAGGRGKAGGIQFASNLDEAREKVSRVLTMRIDGYPVREVLVEERVEIEKELYVGVTIDRREKCGILMACQEGGIEIESVPAEKILKRHISPFLGIQPYIIREVCKHLEVEAPSSHIIGSILKAMFDIFQKEDAELVEINPLALTKSGEVMAVDAKLQVDDNSLFRHEKFRNLRQELSPLEQEARRKGISFIQLEGNIGVIANGAGLTMATLDMIGELGGKGGIFLDLGGTDDPERVKEAFRLMVMAKPSVIFLNIFGGITKCDSVALGVKEVLEEQGSDIPVVSRIKGLNEERAKRILLDEGLVAVDSMREAAEKAVVLGGA